MRCFGRVLTTVSILTILATVTIAVRGQEVEVLKDSATLLYIRTVPSGAKILVDGEAKEDSDTLIELPDGTERVMVEVQWEGQPGEQHEIVVHSGKVTRVEFTQKKSTASGTLDQEVQRRFVRLVVGRDVMTFEGEETTWEELPKLLEQVPDRKHTVLEIAFTSNELLKERRGDVLAKGAALAKELGFEYASLIGIHPLGSRGTGSEKSVHLVVTPDKVVFQGEETTWGALSNLLKRVPNRKYTVLRIEADLQQLPKEAINGINWANELSKRLGFEYATVVEPDPLGSEETQTPADRTDKPAAEAPSATVR